MEYRIDSSWEVILSVFWTYGPPVAEVGCDHDVAWRSFSRNLSQFSAKIHPRRKMKLIVDDLWTPIASLTSSRPVFLPKYRDNVQDHVVRESNLDPKNPTNR